MSRPIPAAARLVVPTALLTLTFLCVAFYAIYDSSVAWSELEAYDLFLTPRSLSPNVTLPAEPQVESSRIARVSIVPLNESTAVRRPGPVPDCMAVDCVHNLRTCTTLHGVVCRIGRDTAFQQTVKLLTKWTARYTQSSAMVQNTVPRALQESDVPHKAFEIVLESESCVYNDASWACAEIMHRFRTFRYVYAYRGGRSLAQTLMYEGHGEDTTRNTLMLATVGTATLLYFFAVLYVSCTRETRHTNHLDEESQEMEPLWPYVRRNV